MKKALNYLTLFLIVANYLLCVYDITQGNAVHALDNFTIGTLFLYVFFTEKSKE